MIGGLAQILSNVPLLLGMAATAIPVILHLVYRRRAPRIEFSTLRFIRLSAERTARRRRIQEWLLLLLRVGVIFLLAVAVLARPEDLLLRSGSGGSAAVAIVMDNSYSMAAEFEGKSRFARARTYALDILRDAGDKGLAAVLDAWPADDEYGKEVLTADANRLADEVAAARVSMVPGDLAAAVVRAEKLLASAPMEQREIYVLTDLQRATWRELPPPGEGISPTLLIIDCGPGDQQNLAVLEVQAAGVRPAAGVPVGIRAKIRNMGDAPATVGVALYIDRRKQGDHVVEVGATATAEVAFTHTFESPGTHTGWVDLDVKDALSLDNRRYFCLDVPGRIPVAVVREKEGALPLLDESFFVVPALNPSDAGGKGGSTIEPTPMLRKDLTGSRLSDYTAVFLLNVPEFSAAEMQSLADYVQGGGGLVIFPGDAVRADAWNTAWDSRFPSDKGMLPARLGPVLGGEGGADPVTLDEVEEEHPVFAALGRMPPRFFSSLRLSRYFDLQVGHGSRTRVLARLSDDKPFLVEKEIGLGRVLLFCTAATAAWSNLPSRTLYLPLLHQITYYLARSRSASADYAAGSVVRFPPVGGKAPQVEVSRPGGAVSRAGMREGDTFARYSDTAVPGIYSWRQVGEKNRDGAFVVNPDTGESDLTVLSRDDLEERILGGRAAHFVRDAKEARSVATRLREGFSLAMPILLAVIALILAECFLANRNPSGEASGKGTRNPLPADTGGG